MRRRFLVTVMLVGVAVLLTACGRHVVLDPETVDRLNDRAWTVKSEPRRVEVVVLDGGSQP
jgi:hypothetical protein